MTPVLAVPDPSALPAPAGLLAALHLLTLGLHLAAMGALVGGAVTATAVRGPAVFARPAVRRLLRGLPVAMAATVSLGVAPLLFLQLSYGRVVYAAAVASAVPFVLVPLLAMTAYACLHGAARATATARGASVRLHVALAGMVAVGATFGSTFALAERPDLVAATYARTASGWALHPEPLVWVPRAVQTLAAAAALGAFLARRLARGDEVVRDAGLRVLRGTARLASVAGLARLALDARLAGALGASGVVLHVVGATAPFAASVLVARTARPDAVAGTVLVVGLFAAVVARHLARLGTLEGVFSPSDAPVQPQWGAFAVFVVALVGAATTITAMLRAWARAPAGPAGPGGAPDGTRSSAPSAEPSSAQAS
ncbi:MAG: hypothetical protein U1E39_16365 [Planctomycetota bacterium]